MRFTLVVTFLLVLGTASDALAQLGFLDKVFAKVTDVNAGYLIGRPLRGNELVGDQGGKLGMHGVGFEVVVDLGRLTSLRRVPDECKKTKVGFKTTQQVVETVVRKPDTVITANSVQSSSDTTGPRIDTTKVTYIGTAEDVPDYPPGYADKNGKVTDEKKRVWERQCNGEPSLKAELAFGYSQMGGFTGRDVPLQGSLENLPAIGIYTVLSTGNWADVYLGIRTGLAQLKGFQAFPDDTGRVTATGSTWQIGIAPGVSLGSPDGDAALFVEAEWMYRKFDDIQWTSVIGPVPASLRRPTHLSTFVLSIGGQIGIGKEE